MRFYDLVQVLVACILLPCSWFLLAADKFSQPVGVKVPVDTWQQWQLSYQAKSKQLDQLLADHQPSDVQFLNALIEQNSPYLLRHAINPINWQAWSNDAFEQAKAQNKLVFLSVGYSTCHWCHVMEQDSFVNVAVAKALNQDYIALKVDRESLPAVDELYTSALTQVTGTSGWPITAILNHRGEPLFIQSFIPSDKLIKLLGRLIKMWRTNPQFLNQNAANVMGLVRQSQSVDKVEQLDWQDDLLAQSLTKAMAIQDNNLGGFAGEPKFPSEGMMMFLLDQLSRNYDETLAKQIQTQLDYMANVGLYDSIHGGFHRYSTDAEWLVPHYEKMLYNQGQLLVVYARAAKLMPNATNLLRYEQVLADTIAFIKRWLYNPNQGFYSAIDAVFEGQDGGFYLRSSKQLAELKPAWIEHSAMQRYRFENTELYGIYFQQPESKFAAKISQQLTGQIESLPHIDRKIITAWNGLAIWGLVEAFQVLGRQNNGQLAFDMALAVAEHLWQRHFSQSNPIGPVLYRDSFNAQLNDIGTLEDYAFLAKGYLALYDVTDDKVWLKRAQLLADIVAAQFQQTNGGYAMTDSRSESPLAVNIGQTKDAEVLPAGAVMVGVVQGLYRRDGDIEMRKLMKRVVNPLKLKVKTQSLSHLYAAKVVANVVGKVNQPVQYFANGKGQIELQAMDNGYKLAFKLQRGWHVNSATPLQRYLRPTKVSFAQTSTDDFTVKYPKGDVVKLGFQEKPLSVYEDEFSLPLLKTDNKTGQTQLTLDVQACSDTVCLMPEKLKFVLP